MSPSQCRMTLPEAWRQDAVVDRDIVVRALGDRRQRAAGHHDRLAALPFDESELLFIGGDHIVERPGGARRQMVGAGARSEVGAFDGARLGDRAADQFLRICPVETHAALRGVHRLGDAEAEPPQMMTERHRPVPVDRRLRPRIGHAQADRQRHGRRHRRCAKTARRSPAAPAGRQACSGRCGHPHQARQYPSNLSLSPRL